MSVTSILQPGHLEETPTDIPELRLPPANLFENRAQRLRQLAEGHSLGDYLRFLAVLADGQQIEFNRHPGIPIPDATLLANCRDHDMPPLAPAGWKRHAHWQEIARSLADPLYDVAPASGRESLSRFLGQKADWLENQADSLLAGKLDGLDLATAPLIGAALQVQWTHLARQLETHQIARQDHPSLCPVCGSHPVASVIRIGGPENGLRYLHCALCSSEWHMVRSKCSNCDNTRDIAYYSVEGKKEVVRAEACPECHTYLKIVHQDKDPQVDPVADDLASLALDLLMGEEGYAKSGINYLMIHGAGES